MSQLELVSTAKEEALSPIIYKDVPCISTEMLAKAYQVKSIQIQQNYANNKERFSEGKHFFLIEGAELKELKNRLENFYSVHIGKNARGFTIWTERGAARHAKMLNSDKAWDVFELLEETFFNQPAGDKMSPVPASAEKLAFSTTAERLPLRNLVNVWAGQSGQSFADCWRQLKAAFNLTTIKDLPSAWIADAIEWVQKKIDAASVKALPAVSELPALPDKTPDYHKQVERALRDALGKLDLAYQLQNFHGTRNMLATGDQEQRKFLHIACMSNINAAAASARTLLAMK